MDRLSEAGIQAHDEPRAFADAIVATLANAHDAARASQAVYGKLFSTQASFASRDEVLKVVQPHMAARDSRRRR